MKDEAIAAVVLGATASLALILLLVWSPGAGPPSARDFPVTITSIPLGAKVVLDGQGLGETPVLGHPVPEGTHDLMVLSHDHIAERTIEVGEGRPASYVWDNTRKQWDDGTR